MIVNNQGIALGDGIDGVNDALEQADVDIEDQHTDWLQRADRGDRPQDTEDFAVIASVNPDRMPSLDNRRYPGPLGKGLPLVHPLCREQLINAGSPVVEDRTVFVH
ncbi:hypothetical protein D3C81_1937320 [compost metagenome]